MQYLFANDNDNYTDLDFSVTRNNQFLEGKDKFPDSDLRELSFDCYSHPPYILQTKEDVLWTPSYMHIIITSDVLERNGEITVQSEGGRFKGVKLNSLLWIEHFAQRSPISHTLKRCTVSAKNAEHFYGPRR